MTWKQQWICSECGRVTESLPLSDCKCTEGTLKGSVVGSFVLMEDKVTDRLMEVQCIPCGHTVQLMYSSLKRQPSCGCRPRHIEIINVNPDAIRFYCKKCKQTSYKKPPLIRWHCEEEN